jgi:hypothetical protein
MKRDDELALAALALLALGGGNASKVVNMRDPALVEWLPGMTNAEAFRTRDWSPHWTWPLARLVLPGGQAWLPAISQEWKRGPHYGVDLMYPRSGAGVANVPATIAAWPPGGRNGSLKFFCPPTAPVLAARTGRVWSVERTARGIAVVIDHGPPWATFYQHLQTTTLPMMRAGKRLDGKPSPEVQAGATIGTAGWDPTDGALLRHLHFACWYKGSGDAASVDPQRGIDRWGVVDWTPSTFPI